MWDNDHPAVWVEAYGHAIFGAKPWYYPGGVMYHVGDVGELPESHHDTSVTYKLVSIYDDLWSRRDEIGSGQLFAELFDYRGNALPMAFDGKTYGINKANTPWGHGQLLDDIIKRGDWLLDPAKVLSHHATFEGDFSLRYVQHPYFNDLNIPLREK
jgi:hypothetical protein